jgi:hypothetical protein
VDLEVAAVDAVVVGDDHLGELDVLVLERLDGAIELLEHEVDASQRGALELLQLLPVVDARLVDPAAAVPGRHGASPPCR